LTAINFFHRYLSPAQISSASYPKRWAEELAKANSVFQLQPYQRNIGCGTFRVLKELGQDKKWFDVWPYHESPDSRFVLAEGYPSLFWRTILGKKKRHIDFLSEYIQKNFHQASLPVTDDDADAAVLAIGAYKTVQSGYLNRFESMPIHKKEGWILGLDVPRTQ
jgi:hypothetical protein